MNKTTNQKVVASLIIYVVSISFLIYGYSTGVTGETKKNGIGCYCHSSVPNESVSVIISGPDQLNENESAVYTVTIQGGPLTRGGTNIAVSNGIINPAASSGLQKIGDELTHILPKAPSNGTVSFEFEFTAPSEAGVSTIYANGNSVNFNGQETGDSWNYAANKIIQIGTVVPVELAELSATVTGRKVKLSWKTITEKNNLGFEIQKIFPESSEWVTIGFIKGAGNSLTPAQYFFEDNVIKSGKYFYRLKQIDYSGEFTYYDLANELNVNAVEKFALNQNYPNPFNPLTKIEFEVPISSNVELNIYNSNGEKIATLVNDYFEAGVYDRVFNAEGLPSGIYFSQVVFTEGGNQNKHTDVKKMLLLK